MSFLSLWIDESEQDNLLVVGGVLAERSKVASIVSDWRNIKKRHGLNEDDEIKWAFPSNHPCRSKLGQRLPDLYEDIIGFVSCQDIVIVCACFVDIRDDKLWRGIWSGASSRDFYCEAVKFVLQRVAEEVVEQGHEGCEVICDTPGLGKKKFSWGVIRRGAKALEEEYRKWYCAGVRPGPGRKHHNGPLANAGFDPSILIGDASYHDMLQIADVVVGMTREWVAFVRNKRGRPQVVNAIKAIVSEAVIAVLLFSETGSFSGPRTETCGSICRRALRDGCRISSGDQRNGCRSKRAWRWGWCLYTRRHFEDDSHMVRGGAGALRRPVQPACGGHPLTPPRRGSPPAGAGRG